MAIVNAAPRKKEKRGGLILSEELEKSISLS